MGLEVSPKADTATVTKHLQHNTQFTSNTWKAFSRRMGINKPHYEDYNKYLTLECLDTDEYLQASRPSRKA